MKKKISLKRILLALLIIATIIFVYGFIEPYFIMTKHTEISDKTILKDFNGFKMVFVSDIHHGNNLSQDRVKNLVSKINSLSPDIILLGGDYVSRGTKYIESCFEELSKLKAPFGRFAVLGNHDHWSDATMVREAMSKSGITELYNEGTWVTKSNSKIHIGGVGDLWTDTQNLNSAIKGVEQKDFSILLSHNPDYVERFKSNKVDLMISGHTHGGQITLLGLYAPTARFSYNPIYRTGLMDTPNGKMLVSNGIGMVGPLPMRIFAPPQINVITLKGAF